MAWRLLVKAHALQKIGKAGIASQRVEPGIHPGGRQSIRALNEGLLEPGKGFVFVTERGINGRHVESANVALLHLL